MDSGNQSEASLQANLENVDQIEEETQADTVAVHQSATGRTTNEGAVFQFAAGTQADLGAAQQSTTGRRTKGKGKTAVGVLDTPDNVAPKSTGSGGNPDGAGTSVGRYQFAAGTRGNTDAHFAGNEDVTDEAGTLAERDPIRLKLYKAILQSDWEKAESIFNEDGFPLTAEISVFQQTALHVAVASGTSNKFLEKLVRLMVERNHPLGIEDENGNSALHLAATAGNTEAARILVSEDRELPQKKNHANETPLHVAAAHKHEKTILYLLEETHDEPPSPFVGDDGLQLLNLLITADFYGFALTILDLHPQLACELSENVMLPLNLLATKRRAFPSGNEQGSWQRLSCCFSHCLSFNHVPLMQNTLSCLKGILVKREETTQNPNQQGDSENLLQSGGGDEENQIERSEMNQRKTRINTSLGINTSLAQHDQALQLTKTLITGASGTSAETAKEILGVAMGTAAKNGIHELVSEIIKAYPHAVWLRDKDGLSIFNLAVLHREEKVFNLIYQVGSQKDLHLMDKDKSNNNVLHLTAKFQQSNSVYKMSRRRIRKISGKKLELPTSIRRVSGAALQMQRELQWYQEVRKHVPPQLEEMRNREYKTPQEVFTESHADLVKEGEEWMKRTASSCNIVAALIITAMLAASFTTPGGRGTDGVPILIHKTSFMIFAVSDALALFSSATSVLTFLGVLTSRYDEKDFLRALPLRLAIGLSTLFLGIVAMLVAFSASVHMSLSHRVHWIWYPIGLAASVPVILFTMLQFPLLREVVGSTFGPSIFRKQSDEILL